jgi:hypothetical protein
MPLFAPVLGYASASTWTEEGDSFDIFLLWGYLLFWITNKNEGLRSDPRLYSSCLFRRVGTQCRVTKPDRHILYYLGYYYDIFFQPSLSASIGQGLNFDYWIPVIVWVGYHNRSDYCVESNLTLRDIDCSHLESQWEQYYCNVPSECSRE